MVHLLRSPEQYAQGGALFTAAVAMVTVCDGEDAGFTCCAYEYQVAKISIFAPHNTITPTPHPTIIRTLPPTNARVVRGSCSCMEERGLYTRYNPVYISDPDPCVGRTCQLLTNRKYEPFGIVIVNNNNA